MLNLQATDFSFLTCFLFCWKSWLMLPFDYMSVCYKGKVGLSTIGGESRGYGLLCKGKASGMWLCQMVYELFTLLLCLPYFFLLVYWRWKLLTRQLLQNVDFKKWLQYCLGMVGKTKYVNLVLTASIWL